MGPDVLQHPEEACLVARWDEPPGQQGLAVERVVGRHAEILQKVQRHARVREQQSETG